MCVCFVALMGATSAQLFSGCRSISIPPPGKDCASLESIDYFLQEAMSLLPEVLDTAATTALKPFPAVHSNPSIML